MSYDAAVFTPALSVIEIQRIAFLPPSQAGTDVFSTAPQFNTNLNRPLPKSIALILLHSFNCTARCSVQPPYSHNINLKALPLYLYIHLLFAMNLSLVKDRPRNTTLISPDGRAMYHINTPSKLFGSKTTTIRRVDVGDGDIGRINWHAFSNTELWVRERLIQPHKSGTFSSSETFLAADGRNYKWKIKGGYAMLFLEGGPHTPIATFHKTKRGFLSPRRLAFLDITPQGVHIVDDIVTTFVWFEQNRREAKQAAAASAGAT